MVISCNSQKGGNNEKVMEKQWKNSGGRFGVSNNPVNSPDGLEDDLVLA